MQIGIPLTQDGLNGRTGWIAGFYYVRNCLNALAMLPAEEVPQIILFMPDVLTEPVMFPEYTSRTTWLTTVKIPGHMLNDPQNHSTLKQYFDSYPCDLEFPMISFPSFSLSTPAIGWIPDFQHRYFPEFFNDDELHTRESVYDFIIGYSNKVACSSQTVQTDLQRFYPGLLDKGIVLKFTSILPEQYLTHQPQPVLERLGLKQKYIYLPNQFWVHKNHKVVFEAWRHLKARGCKYLLVCTGYSEDYRFPGFYQELETYIVNNDLQANVRLMGFLSRADQIQIYRGASAVLQPSLFEGWSTSIEDAKSLGKVLIVSDIPVHHEQCGSEAHFFEKNNPEALADLTQQLWDTLQVSYSPESEAEALVKAQISAKSFGRALIQAFREALKTPTPHVYDKQLMLTLITDLNRKLNFSEADRTAKDEVISRLVNELEAVRVDRSAKDEVISRLVNELEAVRADQAAKEEVITQLQSVLEANKAATAQLGSELLEYKSIGWGLARAIVGSKRKLQQRFGQHAMVAQLTATDASATLVNQAQLDILHIALDVMQIQFGLSGGIEVYMKTLVRGLTNETNKIGRLTLLCRPDQVSPLRAMFDDQVAYHSFEAEPFLSLFGKIQNALRDKKSLAAYYPNVSFAELRETLGVDILHSPVQIFSQLDFTVPSILNLHDLQHLHHPENFSAGDLEARHRLYGQSATLASAIIASSDFVRQDIIKGMGIPTWKVHTIPVAFNPDIEQGLQTFTPEQVKQIYHLPETFGFYPAQFWIHKNHARLIEALAIVRARAPEHDLKLVFSGYRYLSGWPSVEQALDIHNMHDHVILLDFIPTEHLGAIYRLATFCIMPSLFEASSYPVIEAQMLKCPAMCSNVTSLPELMADEAGLLFDPLSSEDMADQMLRWLNDPDDRLAYAERGYHQAQQRHSLATYTAKVVELYTSVLDFYKIKDK